MASAKFCKLSLGETAGAKLRFGQSSGASKALVGGSAGSCHQRHSSTPRGLLPQFATESQNLASLFRPAVLVPSGAGLLPFGDLTRPRRNGRNRGDKPLKGQRPRCWRTE
jgi:hypothetical protein